MGAIVDPWSVAAQTLRHRRQRGTACGDAIQRHETTKHTQGLVTLL